MQHYSKFVTEIRKIIQNCVIFPNIDENNALNLHFLGIGKSVDVISDLTLEKHSIYFIGNDYKLMDQPLEKMISQVNLYLNNIPENQTLQLMDQMNFKKVVFDMTQESFKNFHLRNDKIKYQENQKKEEMKAIKSEYETMKIEKEMIERKYNNEVVTIYNNNVEMQRKIEEQERHISQLKANANSRINNPQQQQRIQQLEKQVAEQQREIEELKRNNGMLQSMNRREKEKFEKEVGDKDRIYDELTEYKLSSEQIKQFIKLIQEMENDDEGFKNKNFLQKFRDYITSYILGEINEKEVIEFLKIESMYNDLTINYFKKYGKRINIKCSF